MKEDLQKQLNAAAVRLRNEVDPDNGLFAYLVSTGVLTDAQVETCRAPGTKSQKVDEILSLLKRQPDDCYVKFCEALSSIERKDLCDYLKQLAGINGTVIQPPPPSPVAPGNGDVQRLPIAEDKKMVKFEDAFDGKWDDLKAKLNLGNGLVTKLRDLKLLSRDDVDEINNPMKTNAQKVECLLDKLERRDPSEFPSFITALEKTNQSHILKLLNLAKLSQES